MRIERINDNQIRCTLTSLDLRTRNLNLGELAYGSEKTHKLFLEMMQAAYREVGFEAEDIPLMVEAIPLSGESVMLVITKIEDPEELDTRFSRFSPPSAEEAENFWNGIASEFLEGAQEFMEQWKKDGLFPAPAQLQAPAEGADEAEKTARPPEPAWRCYRFDSLDLTADAAAAAHTAAENGRTASRLYKNPTDGPYFLVLTETAGETAVFNRICNILMEYGERVSANSTCEAYYLEHYETVIASGALEKLSLI